MVVIRLQRGQTKQLSRRGFLSSLFDDERLLGIIFHRLIAVHFALVIALKDALNTTTKFAELHFLDVATGVFSFPVFYFTTKLVNGDKFGSRVVFFVIVQVFTWFHFYFPLFRYLQASPLARKPLKRFASMFCFG